MAAAKKKLVKNVSYETKTIELDKDALTSFSIVDVFNELEERRALHPEEGAQPRILTSGSVVDGRIRMAIQPAPGVTLKFPEGT